MGARDAIRARFEPESWPRVAQPIFDKLRALQRDALVAHVMHRDGFERMEQLYEYFLVDPGMEPVVQTSRIRLAIASVQLFIQRCLLNLEPRVHPSTINAKQWEWMKRYRVWEANRKIFLYPENWLEPEFRDDKTHLFAELEGALLQDDVSSDLVEDAFLGYLKKLDELARLDIVAMHIEDDVDPARRVLHVFGRTYSQPHKYFYRRYEHQTWTAWEPVNAEIEGDHLAPVVWRDRLYLFWVTFLEKPDPEASAPADPSGSTLAQVTLASVLTGLKGMLAKKQVDVQLHWSEYVHGEWTSPESGGPSVITTTVPRDFRASKAFIHVSKEPYEDGVERGVFIHLDGSIASSFHLAGRNSAPEQRANELPPANPYSASASLANRYGGKGRLEVTFKERIETEKEQSADEATRGILQKCGVFTLLPCNNELDALGISEDSYRDAANPEEVKRAIELGLNEIASLMKPVFYQDNRHTLFVEPSVTERTVEEWQEWVTRTTEPEPSWTKPDWWEDLFVTAFLPDKWALSGPGRPGRPPIDKNSLIDRVRRDDWLVNPATVVKLDETLIGPGGQPGIVVRSALESAGVEHVNVHAGSSLSGGSAVVLGDARAFADSGLVAVASGLNVVGGAGLNSALAKNFTEINASDLRAGVLAAGRFGRLGNGG